MKYNWVSVLGEFQEIENAIIFKGGFSKLDEKYISVSIANIISDQQFGGGIISADVEFTGGTAKEKIMNEACEIILYYDPISHGLITAGIGGTGLCSIRSFLGQWTTYGSAGNRELLEYRRKYRLKVSANGSRVSVNLDGVDVVSVNLPFALPRGQAGLWCYGQKDVRISSFQVTREKPKAFVVMQFTPPYNELYTDVIKPVCEELGLRAVRADEEFGPGIIIADIAKQIVEASVIIADITPINPNVYYEVGYAHAMHKPTILVAEKPTPLPFDVSPFRTLFYENTIAGKNKVEAGLRKHLEAIQKEWSAG
ncbi:MAG: hypothetical protein PHP42_10845 [Bacteroidota bacterium]|nr:hypothetical protein [Bacteroidota bacterium]